MQKAGLLRSVMRAGMRAASFFFPNTPRIWQTKYHGMPIVVWANESIGRRIILSGRFEESEIKHFEEFIDEGSVCLDVGANIGTHAIVMGRLAGANGKVYAFEPNRGNSLLIEMNTVLNKLKNVFVVRRPVSDRSGLTMIKAPGDRDSSLDYYVSKGSDSPSAVFTAIESVTIDDFCNSLEILPNFVKIDVEGAEFEVLKGAHGLLSNSANCCVMVEVVEEYLNRFGNTVLGMCEFMSDIGFHAYAKRNNKLVKVLPSDISAENVFFIKKAD